MNKFKKLLASLVLVSAIYGGGANLAFAAICDNGLGYYKLQADGTDSIGTIGTITGTAPSYTTGIIGNGASFSSASSQYLESAAFVGPASWGINFWYKATTIPTNNVPVARDLVSGTNRVFALVFSAAQATLYGWNASGGFYQTATTNHSMSTGTWYMWTAIWDVGNARMRLYKDGTLFTNVAISGNAEDSSVKLSVGRFGDATNYVNGIIDEVYFRGEAFTDAEITELYNAGAPTTAQQCPVTAVSTVFWLWTDF